MHSQNCHLCDKLLKFNAVIHSDMTLVLYSVDVRISKSRAAYTPGLHTGFGAGGGGGGQIELPKILGG